MKKFFAALAIISLLMTGCGDDVSTTLELPEEYRRAESISLDKIPVDVYFDATVSMRGFTTLAAGNVYRTLPDILNDAGSSMGAVEFFCFGENVRELGGREVRQFSSPEPYTEIITAMHNVIDRADPSHLTIIVTDLFESDADWSNIAKKVRDKFFANHLAVAIIGVKNSFSGEIFDVGLNAAQFRHDSAANPNQFRPFYLFVMGREDAVKIFMQKFAERQTLPNETEYLLLSENLSANDFSAMTLLGMENFFADDKINLADKTVREFGVDDMTEPATLDVDFAINPVPATCPFTVDELIADVKIFAHDGERWEPLTSKGAEISLTPVEGAWNTYVVRFKCLPDECLRNGQINFVHAALSPTEQNFSVPDWIHRWNMANVDANPANFDGAKTSNLLRVVESLKSSIFTASSPALVNLNFVVDLR